MCIRDSSDAQFAGSSSVPAHVEMMGLIGAGNKMCIRDSFEHGMGVSVGRLREDPVYDWKFVVLSHNTVRGAAGGAVLCAETLKAKGYIQSYTVRCV